MTIGSWVIWYFSGPTLSWLTRYTYDYFCNWIHGGPGFWGAVRWWWYCMPPEEHLANYAYSWSEVAFASCSAPLIYWVSNKIQRILNRAQSIAGAGARIVENDIQERLDAIQAHLERLAQDRSPLNSSVAIDPPVAVTPLRRSQRTRGRSAGELNSLPPAVNSSNSGLNLH